MKKILFILVATLGLTACDVYTVKNTLAVDIKVNDVLVEAKSCYEFVDFLTVVGDFPLKFSTENFKSNDKEYAPANYEVSILNAVPPIIVSRLLVKEVTEACKN